MPAARKGSKSLRRLTKRSEFLRAARGNRAGRPGFALQAIAGTGETPGLGFTVSKQCGNSPQRNRIKRRLRAVAATCAEAFRPQHDYVLVGRPEAIATPFAELVEDLGRLIERVHTEKPARHRTDGPRNKRP
jgi:ribonuclease P protein component